MEKLELKHLAPYSPYGLHVKHNKGARLIICGVFKKHNADDFFTYSLLNWEKDVKSTEAKPILRPLSDLTKDIEFNGKKIIPLVELYRNSSEYYIHKDLDFEFIDSWGAKGNILKVYQNRNKNEYTEFVYSNLSFRKESRYNEGSYHFGMSLPHSILVDCKINNIYILQKLLFEWHFDVFGLIDKGLAVDINTIK